jgi:hypothetical protein
MILTGWDPRAPFARSLCMSTLSNIIFINKLSALQDLNEYQSLSQQAQVRRRDISLIIRSELQ